MLFCGIDTSNYTTSAALCREDGSVAANLKEPLPVRHGECGLRQSDAVFAHVKNLPALAERLRRVLGADELRGERIAAFGVSATPRDAEGSYMPCFLSGVAAASTAAAASGVPLYRFSHQSGHIMAAIYSSGADVLRNGEKHLAFHVSGGTTEALLVNARCGGFDVEKVGGTLDLNAGQVIDRVGVKLGMDFPCGAALEALSEKSERTHTFKRLPVGDGWCNLSGLQNLIEKQLADGVAACDAAAYLFDYIAAILELTARELREKHGDLPIVFAGGVMSNRRIRRQLEKLGGCSFAEPQFSADNAAGIALLCRESYMAENPHE